MDPKLFRAQLEQVLRQKNPTALRQFLVEQGQWPEDTTMDAERAMWTMILGNAALKPLHHEARAWLIAQGRQEDAALLEGGQGPQGTQGPPAHKGGKKKQHPGGPRQGRQMTKPDEKV